MQNKIIYLFLGLIISISFSCNSSEIVQEYNDSGALYKEYNVKDGRMHGFYKEYYEDNSILISGQYENDEKTGEWSVFSMDGELIGTSEYQNGLLEGSYTGYFEESGTISISGTYKNDQKTGIWSSFYENGQLKKKINFSLAESEATYFHDNGNISEKGQIIITSDFEYRKNGSWTFHDEKGIEFISKKFKEGIEVFPSSVLKHIKENEVIYEYVYKRFVGEGYQKDLALITRDTTSDEFTSIKLFKYNDETKNYDLIGSNTTFGSKYNFFTSVLYDSEKLDFKVFKEGDLQDYIYFFYTLDCFDRPLINREISFIYDKTQNQFFVEEDNINIVEFDNQNFSSRKKISFNEFNFETNRALKTKMDSFKTVYMLESPECFEAAYVEGEYTVSNVSELLNAINHNSRIIVEDGTYDFTDVNYTRVLKESDGKRELIYVENGGLVIMGINDVIIRGEGDVRFITSIHDGEVINIYGCKDVTVSGIKAYHDIEKEAICSKPVISVLSSENIFLKNSTFDGSGEIGILARETSNLSVNNCEITNCSFKALEFEESQVNITSSKILNNDFCDVLLDFDNSQVTLTNVEIFGNHRTGECRSGGFQILYNQPNTRVTFNNVDVYDNTFSRKWDYYVDKVGMEIDTSGLNFYDNEYIPYID